MMRGIFLKIILRQFQQRLRRPASVFLHVHKRTGQLDQALVKISVGTVPVRQPQFLQHVMRFVKKLAVEAIEEAEVMRVQFLSAKLFNACRNMPAFFAHVRILSSKSRCQKSKPVLITHARSDILNAWRNPHWAGASARFWAEHPSLRELRRPLFPRLLLQLSRRLPLPSTRATAFNV